MVYVKKALHKYNIQNAQWYNRRNNSNAVVNYELNDEKAPEEPRELNVFLKIVHQFASEVMMI